MTYEQLLQDPRWQEKRLEVLQRDDFTCRICNRRNTTLHVHHQYYLENTDPWDYDTESAVLISVCEPCHKKEHELKEIDKIAFQQLLNCGFSRETLHRFIGYISKHGIPQDLLIRTDTDT